MLTNRLVFAHRATFATALLGLATSAFLAWEYARGGPIACPIGGGGCDTVRASAFSAILGVPVPWFGIAFYLTMALLEIVRLEAGGRASLVGRVIAVLAVIGVAASAWFTYLEAFEIGAWCTWCLVSAGCSVAILIFAAIGVTREA